jgi:hypothetical protein
LGARCDLPADVSFAIERLQLLRSFTDTTLQFLLLIRRKADMPYLLAIVGPLLCMRLDCRVDRLPTGAELF